MCLLEITITMSFIRHVVKDLDPQQLTLGGDAQWGGFVRLNTSW